MPESINFRIAAKGDKAKRLGPREMTVAQAVNGIRARRFDPELEEELIKRASSYPTHALHRFMNELTRHITQVQDTRAKK